MTCFSSEDHLTTALNSVPGPVEADLGEGDHLRGGAGVALLSPEERQDDLLPHAGYGRPARVGRAAHHDVELGVNSMAQF